MAATSVHTVDTAPGCYFVTIGTRDGKYLFGSVYRGRMILNDYGEFARFAWRRSCAARKNLRNDAFVVMPNHLHAIVIVRDIIAGSGRYGSGLPGLVTSFRRAVAGRIGVGTRNPGTSIWEESYRERRLRCRSELDYLRETIRTHPARWWEDALRRRI